MKTANRLAVLKIFRWVGPTGLFALLLCCCKTPPDPQAERSTNFATSPERFPIAPGLIDEASGLADSRTIEGYLWTHQDSGNPPSLFLIRKDGQEIRSYVVEGASNRDWEDMAAGPGPREGVSYLYVGDIGNNEANPNTTEHVIYRIPEPLSLESTLPRERTEPIRYTYPDGPRDAETLLLDPLTKDLYIVSKELAGAVLYRLPFPQPTDGTLIQAQRIGDVPGVVLATGGDISADGREIMVKTYTAVYYWQRKAGERIEEVLLRTALKMLPYELEPQGEAICFDKDGSGYFTLSERRNAPSVTLNFYRRR